MNRKKMLVKDEIKEINILGIKKMREKKKDQ